MQLETRPANMEGRGAIDQRMLVRNALRMRPDRIIRDTLNVASNNIAIVYFGPVTIAGSPQPIDGIAHGYCPRRTVLDKLLVDAAVEAGAELREGFTVDEIMAADGR